MIAAAFEGSRWMPAFRDGTDLEEPEEITRDFVGTSPINLGRAKRLLWGSIFEHAATQPSSVYPLHQYTSPFRLTSRDLFRMSPDLEVTLAPNLVVSHTRNLPETYIIGRPNTYPDLLFDLRAPALEAVVENIAVDNPVVSTLRNAVDVARVPSEFVATVIDALGDATSICILLSGYEPPLVEVTDEGGVSLEWVSDGISVLIAFGGSSAATFAVRTKERRYGSTIRELPIENPLPEALVESLAAFAVDR